MREGRGRRRERGGERERVLVYTSFIPNEKVQCRIGQQRFLAFMERNHEKVRSFKRKERMHIDRKANEQVKRKTNKVHVPGIFINVINSRPPTGDALTALETNQINKCVEIQSFSQTTATKEL